MERYDAIVLGLGGMGSAAAMHLASRGAKVLGLERHGPLHDHGSSHGETRLIRRAYFESPAYVPLLDRSYELWDALGAAVGEPLLHRAGLALFGSGSAPGARAAARATARTFGIDVEELDAPRARERFPMFSVGDDASLLWEPGAGYLRVERCLEAHASRARALGAELRFFEAAGAWSSDGKTARVVTEKGTYEAAELVITAGPWAPSLLAELALPLRVHRVVLYWFEAPAAFDGAPCFAFDDAEGFFYGFPPLPGSREIKVAEHAPGTLLAQPEDARREVTFADAEKVHAFVARHLEGVRGPFTRAKTCLYTMTPDEHFVVDRHPRHRNVSIAAGFSGHGFKFAPVIGETLAELATDGRTRHPVGFLRADRFSSRT